MFSFISNMLEIFNFFLNGIFKLLIIIINSWIIDDHFLIMLLIFIRLMHEIVDVR